MSLRREMMRQRDIEITIISKGSVKPLATITKIDLFSTDEFSESLECLLYHDYTPRYTMSEKKQDAEL